MEFVGIRPENTQVLSYQSLPTPSGNCAIIFRSYWALFEQFQRCAHDKAAFRLMPGSEKALQWFMGDVIELFNHGTRPSFPSLFRYGTFDELTKRESEFADITRVVDLLTRGYRLQNLTESLSRQIRNTSNVLWLGMPEHTKNMEFDKVVISDDFFSQTNMVKKKHWFRASTQPSLESDPSSTCQRILIHGSSSFPRIRGTSKHRHGKSN